MALNTTDANLILLYGFDESLPGSVRDNAGFLGSTEDLDVYQSAGSDGIPAVEDGHGGKAADLFQTRAGYTTAYRWFESQNTALGSAHPAAPALPLADADDDFAFGCRFQWGAANTGGGGTEGESAFALKVADLSGNIDMWGISVRPDDPTTPTAAQVELSVAQWADQVTENADWVATGSPSGFYILPNAWYRVVVRVYFNSTGWRVKVYVYEESSGSTYTFTSTADSVSDYSGAQLAATMGVFVGARGAAFNPLFWRGYMDECWLYDAPLSDEEAQETVVGGISIPWVEPDYRVADHDVRVATAHENSTLPATRQLPIGGMNPRHTVNIRAQRMRVKYEGFRPGRPWSRRRTDVDFDSIGPFSSKKHNIFTMGPSNGVVRQPGILPPEVAVDARNVEYSGPGVRRRRGYRIRRDVDSSTANGMNAMFSWRNKSDSLFWLYKVGDILFGENGTTTPSQLDTGWGSTNWLTAAVLDGRLILCNRSNRASWRGNNDGLDSFSEDAPSTGSRAATTGTLVGAHTYAYTFYDPTTGDETAPYIFTAITLATEGCLLSSLDTSSTDSRFSQQRIYRSAAGVAAPDLFLIDTQNNAATYTDAGAIDGTTSIGEVNGDYLTATAPKDFIGCVTHLQRMFYWVDDQLWWSEADEPLRWLSTSFITAEAPITAVVSQGYRVVIYTRNTVEIVESDFARDDSGNYSIRRTVLTRTVGAPGPNAVVDWDDDIWWMDRRGVYRLIGDRIQTQSEDIDNIFRMLNSNQAENVCGAVNHLRTQIWWTAPFAEIQDDNTRFNTVVVLHPGEAPRFSFHEIELPFVSQFDDDLNGVRFGGMDHLGTFKELESYEGDGAEGNESYTTEDEGDDLGTPASGISSISGNIVTVHGTPGWTVDALRGMGVVLRDRSAGVVYYYTIKGNAAGTFTTNTTPSSNLADGDGYYIGGIRSYEEPAEQDFKSPNMKHINQMQTQFDDLTQGRFT